MPLACLRLVSSSILLLCAGSKNPAPGFQTRADGGGEKGCPGDGRSIRLGAVRVSNSAEPLLSRGRPAFQCRGRTRTRIRIATLKAAGAAGAAPRQGITSPAQGPGAVLAAEVIFVPALSLGLGAALGENQLREGEGDGSFIHSLIHSSNNHALYPVDAKARLQTFPFDLLKHSQTRGGLIGLARIPQLAGGTS